MKTVDEGMFCVADRVLWKYGEPLGLNWEIEEEGFFSFSMVTVFDAYDESVEVT